MLASPVAIGENLQTVAKQIRKHVPDRADNIGIAVTEWGPLFHAFPQYAWMDHSKTLGSALFTASMLRTFVEMRELTVATHFKLTDFQFLCLLGIPEGTGVNRTGEYPFQPTPSYYAFQFFTNRFGESLVTTSTESPTFSSKRTGWMRGVRKAPLLEVTASLSRNRNKLYIIAINKSFDVDIETKIMLEGFTPQPTGDVKILSGEGIAAHSGTGPVIVPGITYAQTVEDPQNPEHVTGNHISLQMSNLTNAASTFTYVFPARSVTSIILTKQRDQ